MGLFIDAVMKNADDHPYINLTYCVNRRQRRLECRKCVQICPRQVYDANLAAAPKWDQCQNCGLCVTACASRCIAPSPVNMKRHLMLAEKTGEITISCRQSGVETGHVEACIAQLPWEFLAYLALGGKLILNLKSCKDCPHEDCLELLEDQLYRLKCFLGAESYAQHVMLCFDENHVPEPEGVSRRDFFKSVAHGGRQVGALAVTDAAGVKIDGMIYRRMLAERVRALAAQEDFVCRMELPWFSEKCYGCGICAKLCPNGAIEVSEGENGMRRMYVTPYKCTACGVCMETCREGGVEEICAARLPSLERVMMAEVKSVSCARCGRAISPAAGQEYCAACRQKVGKK